MLDEFTHEPHIACFSIDIALCSEVPVYARRTVGCEWGHVCHMRHLRSGHAETQQSGQ